MSNAHVQISNDNGLWRVMLNGRDVADYLTPDGVRVEIGPSDRFGNQPVATVHLTFAQVELDADLRDAIIDAHVDQADAAQRFAQDRQGEPYEWGSAGEGQ